MAVMLPVSWHSNTGRAEFRAILIAVLNGSAICHA